MHIQDLCVVFEEYCKIFPQMHDLRLIVDNGGEMYFRCNNKGPMIRVDIDTVESLPTRIAVAILAHEFGHAYDYYEKSWSPDSWEREYNADYTGQVILNTMYMKYGRRWKISMTEMFEYFITVLNEDGNQCSNTHPSHNMRAQTLVHRLGK